MHVPGGAATPRWVRRANGQICLVPFRILAGHGRVDGNNTGDWSADAAASPRTARAVSNDQSSSIPSEVTAVHHVRKMQTKPPTW